MGKIKIGLIGLGTVASGVYKTLQSFDNIEIVKIAVRDINKPRNIDNLNTNLLTTDAMEIVNNESIDVVVELIGGVEPAKTLITTAILNGKHVVTANKELLAKHGEELFDLAEKNNKVILYEGAIAGGIPLIMPIKTILSANKINKIEAILNGTTNYILTKMDMEHSSYDEVLKEAQKLGYAEADPTADVEGFDAAYKLATLATISLDRRIKINEIYREGISKVTANDIKYANELGYKIKLIAHAEMKDENTADVRVHPMLVSKNTTLAHIDYVTNAVTITGFPIGQVTLSGPGAGEFPTASSVAGDIVVLSHEIGTTDYILPMMRCNHSNTVKVLNISDTINKYYLSLTVNNKVGVIGKIGLICADKGISLASVLQKGVSEDNTANIIIVTELCKEKDISEVIDLLQKEGCISKLNSMIRVAEDV
ncbi:homoserine dehydrogenase [bacterium]|nr:homoserine dehydrogenase [bacterium]